MSTLQKLLIGAIVAAATGTGLYEAQRASTLKKEAQTLRRQLVSAAAQNDTTRPQLDEANPQLAGLPGQNQDLRQDANVNDALIKYLGNPIPPPSDMDAAYSKKGLIDAVQLAAQNAGIIVKQINIDDSEYPFLVGVVCQNGDWPKLKEQLSKLPGYEYNGTIGSDTCDVFHLVPCRSFPPNSALRIITRLFVREQAFLGRINQP